MEAFLNRTTDGESSELVLAGEYTVFISGVFNGASLAMHAQSEDGGDFVLVRTVKAPSSYNIKVAGNVKFELIEAATGTNITVYVNEL